MGIFVYVGAEVSIGNLLINYMGLPEIANLREAVATKVWRGTVTPEQLKKITEAIHAAAKAIDEA